MQFDKNSNIMEIKIVVNYKDTVMTRNKPKKLTLTINREILV